MPGYVILGPTLHLAVVSPLLRLLFHCFCFGCVCVLGCEVTRRSWPLKLKATGIEQITGSHSFKPHNH